ncbi:MAG TPA: putative sugar nucleotidyl transferase, partial [Bacteroidota bacterium]
DLGTGSFLFVNGRLLMEDKIAEVLSRDERSDCLYVRGEELVGARIGAGNLERARKQLKGLFSVAAFGDLPRIEVEAKLIGYPWHLVQNNGKELHADFEWMLKKKKKGKKNVKSFPGVHLLGKGNIIIEEGAVIKPGAVLDAEEGPIHIGRDVRVFPNATILGPVHVGEKSWIKTGAQIYGETSIGQLCKVGGEVEGSIFHGYSNKQHGGFLGHSYVGAWVNLGADTNNSDLKNNYGLVRVTLGTEQIDTGMQFMGLVIADHSKSAINSMFNTGTVVGVSSNIFGSGFPPKYVPSFSWGAAGDIPTTYNVDKAINVARRVMARRKVDMTSAEEQLFRKVFEITSAERRRIGMHE